MPQINPSDLTPYVNVAGTDTWTGAELDAFRTACTLLDRYTGDSWSQPAHALPTLVETDRYGVGYFPYFLASVNNIEKIEDINYRRTYTGEQIANLFYIEAGRHGRLQYRLTPFGTITMLGVEPWLKRDQFSTRLRITAKWGYPNLHGTPVTDDASLNLDGLSLSDGIDGLNYWPAEVKEAAALLTAAILTRRGAIKPHTNEPYTLTEAAEAGVGEKIDPAIEQIMVEGFRAIYRDLSDPDDQGVTTTGFAAIDRLLAPYRRTKRSRWF
jgi:hypothetical protein